MNKICKKLLKENNLAEQKILPENDDIYTNMIIYLRASELSEYNQELVRADLIEMIVAGQERGDDISAVMGTNYKEVCDEIIRTFPPKTMGDKLLEAATIFLNIISILGTILIIQQTIGTGSFNLTDSSFTLTIGDILISILIAGIAILSVKYICKNAFVEDKSQNKTLEIVKYGCFGIIYTGLFILCKLTLTQTILTCSMIWAILFIAFTFLTQKILSGRL